MKKVLNLLIVLSIFGLFSCSSSHSSTDSETIPDSDDSETIADEDTDSEEDYDFIDDSDLQDSEIVDDSDEYIEPFYPDPVCIYIYPDREDSKLCFGPVKTNVKCKANPKENEYVTVLESNGATDAYENPLGDVEEPMDLNDDFVFFLLNPKDKKLCFDGEYCPNIYGCNRKNEYVYEIVSSKFINHFFAVDGDKIVFNVWDTARYDSDSSKPGKILIGDLKTNEVSEVTTEWGSYGQMQIKFPYISFRDISFKPIIFNIETKTMKKFDNLKCEDTPKIDNQHLVCIGNYQPYATKITSDESWAVDLETYEIIPLSIF